MDVFHINTMAEDKFLQLSNDNKLLSTELNLVDDDDVGRTNVPSYDLLKDYVYDLSTALKDMELPSKDEITVGEMYDKLLKIKEVFGTDYN